MMVGTGCSPHLIKSQAPKEAIRDGHFQGSALATTAQWFPRSCMQHQIISARTVACE
jgi:hypothetical protein